MRHLVDIIKFVFALRRNPFLYFSSLLVTSGCLLFSQSAFELGANLVLSLLSRDDRNISVDSTFTNIIGGILILLGILLFYSKFLKEKPDTREYINDTEVIKKIFSEITTLDELDYFINQALYPYLIQSGLEDYEYFESYIHSSQYHVYDSHLGELIDSFFMDWHDVCKYWESFTPTNVEDKLRPDTWLDLALTEDVRVAIQKVPEAANNMHRSLRELLQYIRNTFRAIDI